MLEVVSIDDDYHDPKANRSSGKKLCFDVNFDCIFDEHVTLNGRELKLSDRAYQNPFSEYFSAGTNSVIQLIICQQIDMISDYLSIDFQHNRFVSRVFIAISI